MKVAWYVGYWLIAATGIVAAGLLLVGIGNPVLVMGIGGMTLGFFWSGTMAIEAEWDSNTFNERQTIPPGRDRRYKDELAAARTRPRPVVKPVHRHWLVPVHDTTGRRVAMMCCKSECYHVVYNENFIEGRPDG